MNHAPEKRYLKKIDDTLRETIIHDGTLIMQASHYSLMSGGKRIRPMIALAFYEALTDQIASQEIYKVVISLELIHTFSLIHDDLPALDNDNLRRGVATCHCQFNEATAILAGDYLLNQAYVNLTEISIPTAQKLALIASLSLANRELIKGEQLDLEGEQRHLQFEELNKMFKQKTGQMFAASFEFGAILAQKDDFNLGQEVISLGQNLGLAFQIQDDVLDVIGDQTKLGKTIGADIKANKNTWVKEFTLQQAQIDYKNYYQNVINQLEQILPKGNDGKRILINLITQLINRDH